jgi:hypothetical protein
VPSRRWSTICACRTLSYKVCGLPSIDGILLYVRLVLGNFLYDAVHGLYSGSSTNEGREEVAMRQKNSESAKV